MAAGVRSILNCLGVDTSGDVSVLGDLFGFMRQRVPADTDTSVRSEVSLLRMVRSVQQEHIHLNVIRVGFDAMSNAAEQQGIDKIDYAIYRIRTIYDQVDLGVGRVLHWVISAADSNGRDNIGSEDEADELSDEWSVPNSGIDCFLVRNISDPDFVGISPVGGDCDKDTKRDGLIAGEIERDASDDRDFEFVARTFAHEIGHFLGLEHNHDDGDCPNGASARRNLMAQTGCIDGTSANTIKAASELSSGQGNTMHDHCSMRGAC
jgi:hypothetical protein